LALIGAARAVSKATLDWAVFNGKMIVLQTQSPNRPAARSETGIKAVLKLIKALPDFTPLMSVSCCEPTGIYNALILQQLSGASFPVWLESRLQIKQAGGLQRGKSDRTDFHGLSKW
jgi:transposase